jgi:hypothetical protein
MNLYSSLEAAYAEIRDELLGLIKDEISIDSPTDTSKLIDNIPCECPSGVCLGLRNKHDITQQSLENNKGPSDLQSSVDITNNPMEHSVNFLGINSSASDSDENECSGGVCMVTQVLSENIKENSSVNKLTQPDDINNTPLPPYKIKCSEGICKIVKHNQEDIIDEEFDISDEIVGEMAVEPLHVTRDTVSKEELKDMNDLDDDLISAESVAIHDKSPVLDSDQKYVDESEGSDE